eukprot:scaffold8123_cov66-Phaeocystis_antarctica.AAC.15
MKANHESSFFFELFNLNIWTFFAHVLKLASDVTYGMQKELFKFLLVTVVGAILAELRSALSTPKLPALPPSNLAEWQQAQLAAKQLQRANLARRRMRDAIAIVLGLWLAGCSVTALMSLSPPLPPPPPPPPPPLLVVVRRVTASRALQAVRYCRAHWVELVLVSSSLLLADWLNVLVTPRADKKADTFCGLQRLRAGALGASWLAGWRNISSTPHCFALSQPRSRSIDSTPLCASPKACSGRQRASRSSKRPTPLPSGALARWTFPAALCARASCDAV